jgi:hypothetical protein
MSRRALFTVAVAALTLCAAVAAWALITRRGPQSPPHISALPQVVGDLQFVEDGLLSDPIHSHDKQLPLPARFETGHRYIFHNIYGTLHDLDFYKQLLERFRSNGFDTRGSFSSEDPSQSWPTHHRDVIFRIVFRDASYSGYLERRLDLSYPKSDGFSDYVLAIESAQ